MDIEKCIEEIANNGKVEDMEELSEILEGSMKHLKDCNEEMYKKYEMKLYKMAYGNKLSLDMAEDIVSKMRPYHMRWTYDETQDIQEQYNITNLRSIDFYIVMNSAYNDYKDLFGENIEMYIKFAIDFIEDEDAKDGKVFYYFTEIPKN